MKRHVRRAEPAAMRSEPTGLLIDDDADIVTVVSAALRRRGMRVYAAVDAVSAIVTCKLQATVVDVLVPYLNLPGVSGVALAHDAIALNLQLRVVYLSGVPEHVARGRRLLPHAEFVTKPCTSDHLVAVVQCLASQVLAPIP